MKEELQKEIIETVKEEVAEIKSNLKERIKLPILVAYCIILVIYNWDVLFYFVLESGIPSQKIAYINKNFTNDYHHRFLIPLLLSFLSTFAFPVLQVGINLLFKEFKNENDQLIKEKEKADVTHEKDLINIRSSNKERDVLQAQVDNKDIQILNLKGDIEKLKKENLILIDRQNELKDEVKNEGAHAVSLSGDIEVLQEVFKSYTDENYESKRFNYFGTFRKFYNFYLDRNEKEKIFIRKVFDKFDYFRNNTIKYSEIEKIDVYDLVDADLIFDRFTEIGLSDIMDVQLDFSLNNKGKEVVYIFRIIEDFS